VRCLGYNYSRNNLCRWPLPYHHAQFILNNADFYTDFKRASPCSIISDNSFLYDHSLMKDEGFLGIFLDEAGIDRMKHSRFSHLQYQTFANYISFTYESNYYIPAKKNSYTFYIIEKSEVVTIVKYNAIFSLRAAGCDSEGYISIRDNGITISSSNDNPDYCMPVVEEVHVIKLDMANIVSVNYFVNDIIVQQELHDVEGLKGIIEDRLNESSFQVKECNIITGDKDGKKGICFPKVIEESYKIRFHESIEPKNVLTQSKDIGASHDFLSDIDAMIGDKSQLRLQWNLWCHIFLGSKLELPQEYDVNIILDLIMFKEIDENSKSRVKLLMEAVVTDQNYNSIANKIDLYIKQYSFSRVYNCILVLMPDNFLSQYQPHFLKKEDLIEKVDCKKDFVCFKYPNEELLVSKMNDCNKRLLLRYLCVLFIAILLNAFVPISSYLSLFINYVVTLANVWFSFNVSFTVAIPAIAIGVLNGIMSFLFSCIICDLFYSYIFDDEEFRDRKNIYSDYDDMHEGLKNTSNSFSWLLSTELRNSFFDLLTNNVESLNNINRYQSNSLNSKDIQDSGIQGPDGGYRCESARSEKSNKSGYNGGIVEVL
jgi:hypothetical protein